jgi:hypothetical protein
LEEFALDHFLGEIDKDVEDAEVAFFQRHLERLHIEPVAGQNAAMVAPAGIGRGAAPASVGTIDDIIMNQGSAMKKFDDGGEPDGAATIGLATTSVAMTKEQESRPKALPSPAEKVAGNFGDRLKGRGALTG